MKKGMQKAISLFLAGLMTFTAAGSIVSAQGNSESWVIYGDSGENTITIRNQIQAQGGPLEFSADPNQHIQRDYAQTLTVQVHNPSVYLAEYYLCCENPYEDLYMNFVENGSESSKAVIRPGETHTVDLSVFAQNARGTDYTITIYAVVDGQEAASFELPFTCQPAEGGISIQQTGEPDPATLATEYTVTNTGSSNITDLTLLLDGEDAGYITMNPLVENYEIAPGESVSVTLTPDLLAMEQNGLETLTAALTAEGGIASVQTQSLTRSLSTGAGVSFDLANREVNTISALRLQLYQEGNPFYQLELEEDSYAVYSDASGETVDLLQLSRQYPEGEELTTAQAQELMDALVDPQTGQLDFTVQCTASNAPNGEEIQLANRLFTQPADEGMAIGEIQVEWMEDTGTVSFSTCVSAEDYVTFINDLISQAEASVGGFSARTRSSVRSIDLDSLNYNIEVCYDIDITASEQLLSYLGTMDGYRNLGVAMDKIGAISTAGNVIETGMDLYKGYQVLSHPQATPLQKTAYAGLLIIKNLNTYGGVQAFGAVFGSIFGGPAGTCAGIILGSAASVYFGEYVEQLMEAYEKDIMDFSETESLDWPGFYTLLQGLSAKGHQCTNAGMTITRFSLPSRSTGEEGLSGSLEVGSMVMSNRLYSSRSPYFYETGYEGEQTNKVSQKVNSTYSINGETIGLEAENSLAQIAITNLDQGIPYLQEGNNTIIRDYDTDPGAYYINTDSRITMLTSDNWEIGYLNEDLDSLQDVRLLPDLAVYPENIVVNNTYVQGEMSTAGVYVYNLGAAPGWAKVTVQHGDQLLYQNQCLYLDAFSQKYLEFEVEGSQDWQLTVTLENLTDGVEESDLTNNTATAARTATLRVRQEPMLQSVESELNLNQHRTYLVLDVADYADLVEISATVNGETFTSQDGTLSVSERPEGVLQCHALLDGYLAGDYPVEITISYYATVDGQRTLLTKTETRTLSMEVVYNTIQVVVDKTGINRIDDYMVYTLSEEGQWELSDDLDLGLYSYNSTTWTYALQYDNSLEYTTPLHDFLVVFSYEKGLLAAWADELDGQTLSSVNGTSYPITLTENEELSFGYLYTLGGYDLPERVRIKSGTGNTVTVLAPPEIQEAVVQFYATLDVDGSYPNRYVTMTLSPETAKKLALADYYDYYSYQIGTVNNSTYRPRAGITYRLEGDTSDRYCSSYSDDYGSYYNGDTGIYKFFFVHDAGELVQGELGLCLGYGGTYSYFNTYLETDLMNYQPEMVLNRSDQCAQVNFRTSSGGYVNGDITFVKHNIEYLFRSNPIYLPVGSYDITFEDYGITQTVEIEDETTLTIQLQESAATASLLRSSPNAVTGLEMTWSSLFDQGRIQFFENGIWSEQTVISSGDTVEASADLEALRLTLSGTDGQAVLEGQPSLTQGTITNLDLSGSFYGRVVSQTETAASGESIVLHLSGLVNAQGFEFMEYTAFTDGGALMGTVTLTGETGTWEVDVTTDGWNGGIEIQLPTDLPDGEYTYSIALGVGAVPDTVTLEYDIDQDGDVNVLDVMSLARYVASSGAYVPEWDFSGDGSALNVLDVMSLAQYVVNQGN